MKRVLLTSDVHGSGHFVKMIRALRKSFDFALICGDVLPKHGWDFKDLSRRQELWFEKVFLPLMDEINGYFILGNDDWVDYDGERKLEGKVEIEGVRIFAYEYVPPTGMKTNREKSEEDIYLDLKDVEVEKPFIFVTHAPPKGILDEARGENLGSLSIRSFALRKKPIVHCFGHIHESFGNIYMKGIRFVNASFEIDMRFYLLEISKGNHNLFFV